PSCSISDPFPIPFKEEYKGDINFLVIGDWGQHGPGTGQTPVADAMKTWADKNHATFVLNLGDSFYQTSNTSTTNVTDLVDHEGVLSKDDPKWKSYWLDVYGGQLKNVQWFSVAGNHDWYSNVAAEVDYFWDDDSRFFLPSLYYVRKVTFGNNISAVFIHIDTDPFYYNYTAYNRENNLKATLQEFNLYTYDQIISRLNWIEQQLIDNQDADWLFVVGHHSLVGDCGLENTAQYYLMYLIPPVLAKHNASGYFNGHAHELSYMAPSSASGVAYFGSGAGGAILGAGCAHPTWSAPFTFGFLSISIPEDGKILSFEFVKANSTDTDPSVIYSGTINSRKCS
ncbi:17000_t:CDS:2, partial [Cetraspora pellucida]